MMARVRRHGHVTVAQAGCRAASDHSMIWHDASAGAPAAVHHVAACPASLNHARRRRGGRGGRAGWHCQVGSDICHSDSARRSLSPTVTGT